MAEKLDLTSAITTPTLTDYRVTSVTFDWDGAQIIIFLRGTNGEQRREMYTGATATSLMISLNKIDCSVTSLQKRILNRLVSDGKLPGGTVSGTPD